MKTKEMKADWELDWQDYVFKFTDMTYTEVCEEMDGLVDMSYCRLIRTQSLKALQPLSEPLVEPVRWRNERVDCQAKKNPWKDDMGKPTGKLKKEESK